MKKLLFVMIAMAGSAVAANAQEVTQDSTSSNATETTVPAAGDDAKAQIKAEELPAAVKQTLEDQEYKGWIINAAYHDKKEERYEVELKNGTESQTVKFSQEGQRLDD